VLKDDCQRTYKIDVETDSTTAATQTEDTKSMSELMAGLGQFMQVMMPAVQAQMMPIEAVKEMMLAFTRRSKMGNAVEDSLDKMQQPQAQADPNAAAEQAKQQAEQQKHQVEMQAKQQELQQAGQLEQAKMQHEAQLEQGKSQLAMQTEQMRVQADAAASEAQARATIQVEQMKAELAASLKDKELTHQGQLELFKLEKEQEYKKWEAELKASTAIVTAQISAKTTMDAAMISAQQAASAEVSESLGKEDDKTGQFMQMHSEAMGKLGEVMQHLQKPKVIIRDESGKIAGLQ
jgi:hypothetical protein